MRIFDAYHLPPRSSSGLSTRGRACVYVCAARAGGWYDDAKWYDTLAYTVRQSRQREPGGRSKIREWVLGTMDIHAG